MVDTMEFSRASKIDLSESQAEPQRCSKGTIAGSNRDNSCQFVGHSVPGLQHDRLPTSSNEKCIAHQLHSKQSELIDNGIEAQDVDSLLDQFLEYEQEQRIDMVQSSQHDHTYATSSEQSQCHNKTGNVALTDSTILSGNNLFMRSCDSMNNNFDSVERCKSHPFDVEHSLSETLDPQCSKKLANKRVNCNKENNKNEKDNSSGNDSDAENMYGVVKINNTWKNKTRLYPNRETDDDLDEFGRNTSLAKYDRETKRYKRTRRYRSSSEDESETIHDRINLKKRRNTNSQNNEDQTRRKRNQQIEVSSEHSSTKARKHYNIEQERKLNFKFDCQDKDSAQEERRVVYIGRISNGTTQRQVWKRFREFGPIEKVTVHFRDDGDNYAFVTFYDSSAAVEAIESGKSDRDLDISFGGRRKYCGGSYVDFDSNTSFLEEQEYEGEMTPQPSTDSLDFDSLLNMCLKSTRKS